MRDSCLLATGLRSPRRVCFQKGIVFLLNDLFSKDKMIGFFFFFGTGVFLLTLSGKERRRVNL